MEDRVLKLEERATKHDWLFDLIQKQLTTIDVTLKSIDKHIRESMVRNEKVDGYVSQQLGMQVEINKIPDKYVQIKDFKVCSAQVAKNSKYIWMGIGGLAALEVVLQLVIK